jgi:hypothetical protein
MITRVRRILRQKFLIITAGAIAGLVGAFLLVSYMNDQIRPTYQGTATVFLQSSTGEEGGRSSAPDLSLTEAEDAAIAANEGFLDPKHGIRLDTAASSLQFIVTARTEEAAITEASDMRNRYLIASAPAPIEDQIASVLQQAHFVREELDKLLPPEVVPQVDPIAETQYSVLTEQIRSLNSESAQLAVALVLAETDGEKADIQEDLDLILTQINDLQAQLDALPPEVAAAADERASGTAGDGGGDRSDGTEIAPSNLDLNEQFQVESLQSLYSTLLNEFQTLYIQSINAAPQTLPDVEVTDETADPIPAEIGAGVGLVVALLLIVGAILVIDRLRPRWWSQQEVESPLAEVPDRRGDSETWYWRHGPSKRKEALQRSAVRLLPTVEAGPAAIGLVGHGVDPLAIRRLAYDLGAVLVTSGRRSLVIDTTGLEANKKREAASFTSQGLTVGDMLNPWFKDASGERAKEAVIRSTTLWPGLNAIASGPKSLFFVEGAMTPVVGRLIKHARDAFSLTIVPVADRGGALTEAFTRNLDAIVVVGRGGKTKLREAERLVETFKMMGKPVLGSLLIVRPTRRRLRELFSGFRRREPKPAPASLRVAPSSNGGHPETSPAVTLPRVVNGDGRDDQPSEVVLTGNKRPARSKAGRNGSRSKSQAAAATSDVSAEARTDDAPTSR